MSERHQILLAEDNPPDVLLVREALAHHGIEFDLTVFHDGDRALQFLDEVDENEHNSCPDLAMLDLGLPKTTGASLLARIRHSPKCGHIPIVILSASDSPDDLDFARALGASFFRKPTDLDDFLRLGLLVKDLLNSGVQNNGGGQT